MATRVPSALSALGLVDCLPVVVFGSDGQDASRRFTPLGYAQALLTTLSVYPVAMPAGTTYVLARAEAADCRWRDDGTDPTGTVGMPLAAGDTLYYDVESDDLRFTASAAGSILNLSFYGDADA